MIGFLALALDAEASQMAVLLVCNRCPQREILPIK
jgi:hypothetical protein